MTGRAGRRGSLGRPTRLGWVTSSVALLLGLACSGADSPRWRWDPDAEVLPLRQKPVEEPQLRSMVILLPDADGSVGVIEVANEGGAATLDGAREAVAFDDLENPFIAGDDQIAAADRMTLEAEPQAPREFTVFFRSDGTGFAAGSEAAWQAVVEALTGRPVPEVTITAHADRKGSERHNLELSERRAAALREALERAGLDAELIEVAWYGEARPAVPTEDGVAEPRNRRAVIRVR